MNRQVKTARIPEWTGRTICVSDIHGDLKAYKAILEKSRYVPGTDRLLILGDLMEKGSENLALLRYVIAQKDAGEEIHLLMGNCDFICFNVLYSYRLDFIRTVLLSRKNSLIHEMVAEAGLEPIDEKTDLSKTFMELRKRYLKELSFLADLPHVLFDGTRIYAHAALVDETDFKQDWRHFMTTPFFMNTDQVFSKPVICGHMPVSEYCRRFADFNPKYSAASNIWDIDGGNQVNQAGQLNALIFDGNLTETKSVDLHPKIEAVQSHTASNPAPFYLPFNHSKVEEIQEESGQIQVHSDFLNRELWMEANFYSKGRAVGYTNYRLSYSKGDTLDLIQKEKTRWLAKRNGILGWVNPGHFIEKNGDL